MEYNGSNLHTRGLNIQNDGDTVYNLTGSIIKEAGKSTIRETSSSTGYGISLAKGLTDGKGTINPLKSSNITASINASGYRGRSSGVYYANNQDVTKGNSHYNVAGDAKVTGVDVKTGSVSGTVGGKMTVESVQDEFTSEGRGYSAGISAGIGRGFDRNNPKGYGVNLSSVSAGHTRTDVEQRITRNVTEFTAGAGFLDVKGTVKQVGSLVDGNFTLNSGGYEHEDLKDIDKSRTAGINVTVYPNVSYSQRDKNGNQVYIDGQNPKKTGTAIKTGFTYGETDKTREILATVGAGVTMNQDLEGVNRDPNRQTTEFEGRELKPVNVDLLTEYWATEAGRGKFRDIAGNSARSTQGIINVITRKSDSGEYNLIKNIISESIEQKMERIGFIDVKGKTVEQIQKEVESRFGGLTKKGIKVRFYGTGDMDLSSLTKEQLNRLMADGFATTGDGYIWINKDRLTNDTIDLNKLIQHELTHQILGDDTEYQARYVEGVYGDFLKGIKDSGYLTDGEIVDLMKSSMTDGDKDRLNGYGLGDMQYRMFLDKKLTDKERNAILTELQKITNNKLKIIKTCPLKDCYEVVYDKTKDNKLIKRNKKDYGKSDRLILDLISTEKEVWITNQRDPNKWFGTKGSMARKIEDQERKWYQVGVFKNVFGKINNGAYVKIDLSKVDTYGVWNEQKQILELEKGNNKFITLGHELIHVHHYFFGRFAGNSLGINYYKDGNYIKKDTWLNGKGEIEEYRTVGLGYQMPQQATKGPSKSGLGFYNIGNDITENILRKEHGMRLRARYTCNKEWC